MQCVVTGGVVLNPASILQEIDGLMARGIEVGDNLMLSDRAHVIFPWHIAEDAILDKSCSSGENIGTTMRGIGPCYRDKVARSFAVRLGDLYRARLPPARSSYIAEAKNKTLAALDGTAGHARSTPRQIASEYLGYAERLKPFVADTTAYLLDAVEAGKRVLFEGAQGALLDVDHGTFPFVTSSNSSGVGVSSGSGVPGRWINKVIGVVKAYSTRVGGGPFPTEQDNDIGQHIRDRGNEYGTVTRRPRRCGWFDAVAVRYTARLSGVDALAVMLLDVLSELPRAEDLHGLRNRRPAGDRLSPATSTTCGGPSRFYETLPGWQQDITRRPHDGRPAARRPASYLDRLSELIGRPVEVVSVGPDREQTIFADA